MEKERYEPKAVRHLIFVSIMMLGLNSANVSAQAEQLIEAVPNAWRLQDYTDGSITLYYTGSSCASGQLSLAAGQSSDVKQRFWSAIMTAKAARLPVGIFYTNNSGYCTVNNYYMKETG